MLRMERASGSVVVSARSATFTWVGSSRPPEPVAETTGMPRISTRGQQVALRRDVIDGVDDEVGTWRQQLFGVSGVVRNRAWPHVGLAVDPPQTLGHDLGLVILPTDSVDGVELPVEVGDANSVEVHDGQHPDT